MASIEVKKPKLTEAEKATFLQQEQKEKQERDPKNEQRIEQAKRKADMQTELEKTESEAKIGIESLKQDVAPEKITSIDTLRDILSMKIMEYPKSVPAYLDFIVEKNPTLLEVGGVSTLLAQKIQELLVIVSQKSELSGDRDWMDQLRHSINHLVINPTIATKLTEYSTMDKEMREKLMIQLGVEKITE
jgi:hypothetical protein